MKEYVQDVGIEEFMRRKNGYCPNSKDYLKYYIPCEVYDLFEVLWLRENSFDFEFFTLHPDYKEIWSEFRKSNRYGHAGLMELGYDDIYHCYVVHIRSASLLAGLQEFHSPYRYMGESVFFENAHKLGYTNDTEIREDWINYHNNIGRKFQSLGLLPYRPSDLKESSEAVKEFVNDKFRRLML